MVTVSNVNAYPNKAVPFIEVRSYDKRVVNVVSQTFPTASENTLGTWKVKYINKLSPEIVKLASLF